MRTTHSFYRNAFTAFLRRGCLLTAVLAVFGTPLSVSAQCVPERLSGVPCVARAGESLLAAAAQQAPATPTQVRRLSVEEAVRLAAENNLGIQIARYDPQIQDLNIAQARASWAPTFSSSMRQNSQQSPPNSFLSGAQDTLTNEQFSTTADLQQALPWGARYSVGWDSARSTTNNFFSNFNPQLRSSLSLNYTQPLLRNFRIDTVRQQLHVSQTNREIADLDVREQLTATSRNVRNAYWNLAYQIASLEVARQSLELARESLRNTRSRIEIGTIPPIDEIENQAEVAQREEAVIVAEAQIETAEDTLRALVFNPSTPDFWSIRIQPDGLPTFEPVDVNVETAIRSALDRRSDLARARKSLEISDVNIAYQRNQTLPDISASFDYGLSGLGGTQFLRAPSSGFTPGDVIGQTNRRFGSVLTDLLANEFPTWTFAMNVSYPIGRSQQEAALARTRLQRTQTTTQLRNQELQVETDVRVRARQVQTNQQRVQTTRTARELMDRRLDAEQRKLAAGTSTNFQVLQAQRDLAQARNNELRAILDYNQSVVDLETVQEVPVR